MQRDRLRGTKRGAPSSLAASRDVSTGLLLTSRAGDEPPRLAHRASQLSSGDPACGLPGSSPLCPLTVVTAGIPTAAAAGQPALRSTGFPCPEGIQLLGAPLEGSQVTFRHPRRFHWLTAHPLSGIRHPGLAHRVSRLSPGSSLWTSTLVAFPSTYGHHLRSPGGDAAGQLAVGFGQFPPRRFLWPPGTPPRKGPALPAGNGGVSTAGAKDLRALTLPSIPWDGRLCQGSARGAFRGRADTTAHCA